MVSNLVITFLYRVVALTKLDILRLVYHDTNYYIVATLVQIFHEFLLTAVHALHSFLFIF